MISARAESGAAAATARARRDAPRAHARSHRDGDVYTSTSLRNSPQGVSERDRQSHPEHKRLTRYATLELDEQYPLITSCSAGPYLELFARGERPGWSIWGDQAHDAYAPTWPTYAHHSQTRLVGATGEMF